jgi:mannitol/fructose-specific phosphotransferase system IIA component (Ntr-type)
MKLSELSTDRATDVLCEIAPYVISILEDEELLNELKTAVDFEKAETMAEKMAIIGNKFTKIVPIILKGKKQDLFGIIGALNEKTPEEIAKQNIVKTMKQIREITKDKDLLDFFKSCTGTEESE